MVDLWNGQQLGRLLNGRAQFWHRNRPIERRLRIVNINILQANWRYRPTLVRPLLKLHLRPRPFLQRCLPNPRRRLPSLIKQALYIGHTQLRSLIAPTPLLLHLQQPVPLCIMRLCRQLQRLVMVGALGEVLAGI